MSEILKTPIYEDHVRLNARMVEFAGYSMPIQYKGLIEEHNCVRTNVGLFDVSHMGEIRFKGPNALATLQWLTTNDLSKIKSGEAQYNLLTNHDGGLVDDIIVYCLEPQTEYLVCVNAANKDKDFKWMTQNNKGADITDESSQWGQIAVQGPMAHKLIYTVLGIETETQRNFTFIRGKYRNGSIIVARTGYTGETGVEVFVEASVASKLWNDLLEKGSSFSVQPIGLGARDTLRTEMKYSLYGHEIDDTTNPYEAGLGWVVKLDAKDFLGKEKVKAGKESPTRKLVGFKMLEKGIPRQGYKLFSFDNQEIGYVTSGTHSPSLDAPIGIGYVQLPFERIGNQFCVDIRGRKVKAEVVKTPFVNKN
jgi:aminomethyltransferase